MGTYAEPTYTTKDPRPNVEFDSISSTGAEEDLSAQIAVSLSHASSKTVTVNCAVTGGTPTGGGVDYTLDPGVALKVLVPFLICGFPRCVAAAEFTRYGQVGLVGFVPNVLSG